MTPIPPRTKAFLSYTEQGTTAVADDVAKFLDAHHLHGIRFLYLDSTNADALAHGYVLVNVYDNNRQALVIIPEGHPDYLYPKDSE